MIIYEDFTIKNFRTVYEEFENKKTRDELRGASDVFTNIYRKVLDRKNMNQEVAAEFGKVLKRIQDDLKNYNNCNDKTINPPSIIMDEVINILSVYMINCKKLSIYHKITISKETLSIEVTTKAGEFYPEMRKTKLETGNLFLSKDVLATVIIKIFDPRFKTNKDFEEIIMEENKADLNYLKIVESVYLSTFKNKQATKLEENINIDINNLIKNKKCYFSLEEGRIRFICGVNDFLPIIIGCLSKGPDLSFILMSISKKQINESLDRNLRLFMDEIHKTRVILKKKNMNEKEELEELPSIN